MACVILNFLRNQTRKKISIIIQIMALKIAVFSAFINLLEISFLMIWMSVLLVQKLVE